ncbi:MAG: hypothetical protein WBJ16_00235 [Smithellaceae bacterium]
MKVFNIKNINLIKSQNGATLVVIIITMVALAVIGIAIYSLTYTASLNQVVAQRAAKAFYIAESCVRVAASEYKASATKNATLINLHNQTFPMPGGQGSCTVFIYPYWFYAPATTTYPVGATAITLYLPGAVPLAYDNDTTPIPDLSNLTGISGKLIKRGGIGDERERAFSSVTFGNFNTVNGGTDVTFGINALTTPLTITEADELYIAYNYTSGSAPIGAGGDLILNIDPADNNEHTAKIFPPGKGSIFVDTGTIPQYSYDERIIDSSAVPRTVTLTNIQYIGAGPPPAPFFPPLPQYISVGKSIGFRSKSEYGD